MLVEKNNNLVTLNHSKCNQRIKLLVQVKSGTTSMSRKEARKLRYVARSKGAKGLVISVKGRKIKSRFVY